MPTPRALGIDAAGKTGWVGVIIDQSGYLAGRVGSLGDLIDWAEPVAAIGIDIPIGSSASGVRSADLAARAFVGPRRSSVFAAPPANVFDHLSYTAANAELESDGKPKMSRQSWALLPKIVEAQSFAHDMRVIEVHPEVSFRALDDRPITWSKKTWNGQILRRQLLARAGIDLPDEIGDVGRVAVDDVLDAAAAAWSALRHAGGTAISLPADVELDPAGRRISIWY